LYYYEPREAVENQRKITIESTTTLKSFISSSAELLLREFPWILEKSIIRTDSYYAGGFQEKLEILFKIDVSANIIGSLSEAVVEDDKIFLADSMGIYALSRTNGKPLWGVEAYSNDLTHRATRVHGSIKNRELPDSRGLLRLLVLGNTCM